MADTPSPVLALVSRQRAERSKFHQTWWPRTSSVRACVLREGGGREGVEQAKHGKERHYHFSTLACLVLLISVARHLCTWVEGDSLQNSKCTLTLPLTYRFCKLRIYRSISPRACHRSTRHRGQVTFSLKSVVTLTKQGHQLP